MEEATQEIDKERITFERSQNLKAIVDKAVAATIKIGGNLAKIASDVFTSIFKR